MAPLLVAVACKISDPRIGQQVLSLRAGVEVLGMER